MPVVLACTSSDATSRYNVPFIDLLDKNKYKFTHSAPANIMLCQKKKKRTKKKRHRTAIKENGLSETTTREGKNAKGKDI